MKKLILLFCIAFTCLISSAQTNKEYEKAVMEYLEVTNTKETAVSGLVAVYQGMNLGVKDLQGMSEEIVDAMWPIMIKGYIPIMQQYYTLDDLKAIIAFYKTPAGKKLAKYNPEVAQKAMELSTTPEMINAIQPIIFKYLQ